ncbi:hypothetical protein COO60DRAFT_278956 [Scenedesmus sp. NREL 46B-D3]|nr:hypothetical protein COO60DRAFT_278956 [Scenedesmus sp. NREL 46B-D3]
MALLLWSTCGVKVACDALYCLVPPCTALYCPGRRITHAMTWLGSDAPCQVQFESRSSSGELLHSWHGQGEHGRFDQSLTRLICRPLLFVSLAAVVGHTACGQCINHKETCESTTRAGSSCGARERGCC